MHCVEHQELKLLHMVETTYHQINVFITKCNAPVPQMHFVPLYPEQTQCSINYILSVAYLKLNVECPIVFVESGHCVLLISEVQDSLSLLFSVCITALKNVIPELNIRAN